ncbi:hypothetical protein D3C80_1592310 [compost metagenome]
MDGIGHCAPAVNLRLCVDPGGVLIALALPGNLRGFADQQACAGALAVISGRELAGDKALTGAVTCQRRQDDAVRQREGAKRVRGEQILIGHLVFLPCPLMEIGGVCN